MMVVGAIFLVGPILSVPFLALVVGIPLLVWLLKSVKIVGPKEMGVKTVFGRPIAFADSGLHFVACGIMKLYRYPRSDYKFDLRTIKVVSKTGKYQGIEYGGQEFEIDPTLYFAWPQNEDLIDAMRTIKASPEDEAALEKIFSSVVADAFVKAASRITWKEILEERKGAKEKLRQSAEDILRKEGDSIFVKAKIPDSGVRLVLREVRPPRELVKEFLLRDQRRIEAEVADEVAKTRAIETVGAFVRAASELTGKTPEAIREEVDKSPELQKELRAFSKDIVLRRMSLDRNALVDIRVDSANCIEKMLLDLLAVFSKLGGSATGGKKKEEDGEKETDDSKRLTEEEMAEIENS